MKFRSESIFALTTALLVGCGDYDPPPEATLEQPEGGAFSEGDPVHVAFSEKVDESSLAFRVWPSKRNVEGELPADLEPLVDACTAGETCGDLSVKVVDGRKRARLEFTGDLGTPGSPLIVELLAGLADENGNDTGIPRYWDLQFKAAGGANGEPVEFDNGTYILLSEVAEPIPAVLTYISDVRVREDGQFALAGAEGDEINGAPKNTRDPENLIVDETDQGYTVYAAGFITLTEDGKRLLETDPFDVTIPVGPLDVEMEGVRLFADIVKNPDTGKDRLDGTLAFEKVTLVNGERTSEHEGGSTALVADFVPPDLTPDGHPQVCGDQCGLVVAGYCEPPEDFPGDGFCEE